MVECDSDAEVIAKAKAMLDGLNIEIWTALASSGGFRLCTPNRPPQSLTSPIGNPVLAGFPSLVAGLGRLSWPDQPPL
jgi:hypothetical protein